MRILNIYFKNINSLEGEGRVYFDQAPIADSGVFAITGPNGSGKTSILDVITLGLYGETFRFDKPSEHIITKHANESFAQVEFAFAGERYRSIWQVKRADVVTPEMTLLHLNGEEQVLAQSPYQVRSYLSELTGFDFHKFCKSIMLPQGDFAAFLNALDSERMDILEKISGTDLYAGYRNQLTSTNADLKEKVLLLEKEIELIPLLDDDALHAAEEDLADFTNLSDELKSVHQKLEQQLLGFQNISAIKQQYLQFEVEQKSLQAKIKQSQLNLNRIAQAQTAIAFKDDLLLLDKMQLEIQQKRNDLKQIRDELTLLQRQLAADGNYLNNADLSKVSFSEQKQLVDAIKLKISELKLELPRLNELSNTIIQQLSEKQTTLTEVDNWLQAHGTDALLLTDFPEIAQLRNLREELAALGGQDKNQSSWSKKTAGDMDKNKTALSNAQNRLEELKKQITADENAIVVLSQGKSFEELKALQADQQNRLKDFEDLFSLASLNTRLTKTKGFFGLFTKQQNVEPIDEAPLQARLDDLQLEMSKEDNITRALEQAITNEALLKKMLEHRDQLVDGKPCFLCGSTNHPYQSRPPLITDSKKALADQRSKNLLLKTNLNDAHKALLAAQKVNSRLTAKEKFLQQKRSEWSLLANRLNVLRNGLDINDIPAQEKLLIEEADELERIKQLVEDHAQLQRNIAKAKDEIQDKQALLTKLRLIEEQLQTTLTEKSPILDEFNQKYKQLQADEKALALRLEQQLKLLGEKLPGKGKENTLFDKLNARRQDYQIYELRQKGLSEECLDLQHKLESCQASISRLQQQLAENTGKLGGEETLGLHLALLEKQKLVFAIEQEIGNQESALERFRGQLLLKITELGYTDIAQISELLNLIERQTEIQTVLNEQTSKLLSLNAEIAKLENQLNFETVQLDASTSEDELLTNQKVCAEKLDITEAEIRTLQNKLEKQQQYRRKYNEIAAELAEQHQAFLASETEMQLITNETGGLRQQVQRLLVDKLLSQTNQILETISGRYYVRSASSDYGLALEIEDTKQKNVRRLPKSLSGGESFVVSLALSLALAEVANNGKAAIDSLFLDEGFGNLDAESLYLALSTLEGLKIKGKTVGIISHVEGVKKRIKTQIELVKKSNGLSELKMVA